MKKKVIIPLIIILLLLVAGCIFYVLKNRTIQKNQSGISKTVVNETFLIS